MKKEMEMKPKLEEEEDDVLVLFDVVKKQNEANVKEEGATVWRPKLKLSVLITHDLMMEIQTAYYLK